MRPPPFVKRASTAMLKRILREPLVHFLALALLIFAAHGLLRTGADAPEKIVVSASKIEQMAKVFTKTWQRSPTADELKGMIDDYVKEEILVRQALELGLDRDDTVVRRRLRQKMEFLNAADAVPVTVTDPELEAYLEANPATFATDAKLAFEQVFLNPARHGDTIAEDAAALLAKLAATTRPTPLRLAMSPCFPRQFCTQARRRSTRPSAETLRTRSKRLRSVSGRDRSPAASVSIWSGCRSMRQARCQNSRTSATTWQGSGKTPSVPNLSSNASANCSLATRSASKPPLPRGTADETALCPSRLADPPAARRFRYRS